MSTSQQREQKAVNEVKLGIVGGGQLGRMLIQAALDLSLHIEVLDPSAEAPCKPYAHRFTQGSLVDYDTVYDFGKDLDQLTVEIENVNTEALEALQKEGKTVYPDPKTLRLIQDKRLQKQFFEQHNLPTSPFRLVENQAAVIAAKDMLPAVHKLGKAGYDGRGVQILRNESDLEKAFDEPGLLEELVPFDKELAVLVARNPQGETVMYPVVEMVFHPEHNLVEYLFAPAEITAEVSEQAKELARQVVTHMEYVGLMAVEMFLTDGKLLINEVAPRPHNSGHHTIKACYTSQYEQHLRAILGLPLGSPDQMTPAAMVNLLGESGHQGPTTYEGLDEAMRLSGVYPHVYGKAETRPFRKMGHVTLLAEDLASLKEKAVKVKETIRVVSR